MLPNYTLRIIFKVRPESAKRLMRSLGLNIDTEPLVLLNECCWLNAGVEECIPVVQFGTTPLSRRDANDI